MKDKGEKISSLKDYLEEVKAGEKSKSLRESTDRFIFEDNVRELLETLRGEGFSIEEGLVQIGPRTEKVKGFERPDFLVSKEDILFYVYLLLYQDAGFVKREFLRELSDVLQINPKITAVVLVWNFENLPSCVLDSFVLRKYIEKAKVTISLRNERISALTDLIRDFYNEQFVEWKLPKDLLVRREGEEIVFNLPDALRRNLDQKFQELKETIYRIPGKKKAKESILKIDRDKILDRLLNLLMMPKLSPKELDSLEAFLKREIERLPLNND